MKMLYLLLLSVCTYSLSLFEYDRAVLSAQRDQLPEAINLFNNLVAQQPDKADLLYDAGVAAFKHEDFIQAKAYFDQAAQNKDASRQLKAQAYFNKGNTHVALNELKEALSSYQQTLLLFPEDDRAKHNYEVIKKMLEQQEREQQQQEEQSQQQDQNQQNSDKQDKQNNRDQKNNDQGNQGDSQQQDKSDASQKSSDKNQSQDATDNHEKKEGDQSEREHEGLDQERDEQNDQQGGTEQQQDTPQNQEQRDKGGESQQGSEQDKKEEQQNRDHESPLQDELQQQDMQRAQKEQEQVQEESQEEQVAQEIPLDPRLQQVLQKRGDRDAALNKQMIKALVNQEMKGQHGQNCW